MKEDFNDYIVREDNRLINYFSYHYFLLPKKIIFFFNQYIELILLITKLIMCCLLFFNFYCCIEILFTKVYFDYLVTASKNLVIDFLLVNTIFIILFFISCRATYVFLIHTIHRKYYEYKFGNHSIRSNNYFRVKTVIWYLECFGAAAILLILFITEKGKTLPGGIMNVPFLLFSTSWVIGAIYFIKGNISKYFNKFFFEFEMETTIQVDYLDFQNDKIIDKNPHIQEGQLLKIQVEHYPKNKENANMVSILNTKTPNKEAVVFQFHDYAIAEAIRNDDKAIEVSVIKIHPYYKLDLKLKRNFLFDDEKKIYDNL